MDDQRFDRYARSLAETGVPVRRRAFFGALGLGVAAVAAAVRARSGSGAGAGGGQPTCATEGEPCTIISGCCAGLTCVRPAVNPNNGVCVATPATQVVQAALPTRTPEATKMPKPTKTPRPTKTPKPTKTPAPKEQEDVTILLECNGPYEKMTIRNNVDRAIRIESIRTLDMFDPVPATREEPFFLKAEDGGSILVAPGQALVLRSGLAWKTLDPDIDLLARYKLFSNSPREGIRIKTTIGVFEKFCSDRRRTEGDRKRERHGSGRRSRSRRSR